ncbi:hypothetical protein OROGR_016563 [Orobanche gracilis]
MSRCFPYPPPGYTLSRATNESLIESIKLQKEIEKKKEKREKRNEKKERKKERKERKKERKERKRERKEREKEKKDETNQNSDKSDITKDHIVQKSLSDAKLDIFYKNRETGTEQLERSNLTEEHARPVSLSIPSTSSESTENNNKRKRHSSPRDDTCGHGKVILIRLPSEKQDEFDVLAKEDEQPCSTSGRSPAKSRDVALKGGRNLKEDEFDEFDVLAKEEEQPCSTSGRSACPAKSRDVENTLKGGCNLKNNSEQQKCSSFGQIKGKNGIKSTPESVLSPMQKMDLQYKNLLENRFQPQIQDMCLYTDDLDWLLKGRNQDDQETRAEKKRRFASDSSLSCSKSVGLWLRAEYLREVDVYALPFTVPY